MREDSGCGGHGERGREGEMEKQKTKRQRGVEEKVESKSVGLTD